MVSTQQSVSLDSWWPPPVARELKLPSFVPSPALAIDEEDGNNQTRLARDERKDAMLRKSALRHLRLQTEILVVISMQAILAWKKKLSRLVMAELLLQCLPFFI